VIGLRIGSAAALAGAADAGSFLATRRRLFREAPGRAGGSVAALALWLGVAASARRDAARGGGAGRLTVGLASANALGQAAMLGVHLRHRIAGPRVWVGAGLGAAALGGVIAGR
jgi:hypothetical protein